MKCLFKNVTMGERPQIHGIREAEGILEVGAHGLEGLQGTGDHRPSYVRDEESEAQPGSETLRLWREPQEQLDQNPGLWNLRGRFQLCQGHDVGNKG